MTTSTSDPSISTTSRAISIQDNTTYEEEECDGLSDSSEAREVPPTWISLRLTHLIILIPLSFIVIPALAVTPVCLWYLNGFNQNYTFFKTFFTPFLLGCLGFLACFGLKKSILDSLIQVLFQQQPHHHHVSFNLAVCLVLQVALTELIRLAFLVNQKEPDSRILPTDLIIQADSVEKSFRIQSRLPLDIHFFIVFWVGLGWSFMELIVIGCSEWIQQVILYKHVLFEKEDEEPQIGNEENIAIRDVHPSEPLQPSQQVAAHVVTIPNNRSRNLLNNSMPRVETQPSDSSTSYPCLHDHSKVSGVPDLNKQLHYRSASSKHTPRSANFLTTAESAIMRPGTSIKTNVQIGEGTYQLSRAIPAPEIEHESEWDLNEDLAEIEILRIAMESVQRQSVENAIGLAIWQIPWFIIWIWRLNSTLLTIAISLLLSRGIFSIGVNTTIRRSVGYLALVIILKSVVVILWSFQIKAIGLIPLTYITLLICLSSFVSSLGLWGLLS
ncbi:hypothetical protein CROQUDRAFT_664589 [Cronartium quercuum f. sp. fusiforme G11]|uniref:Transmembrane protein n=1 Tax=Cronartium quercuum f. sp. fusiforme G11 TaxID=708437 RepID=A0A9P6NBU8_9BASI|nr:hypothetical protein CROQUDRAFT_664589 [Cronartium quercuum f. sp. fusiforme G11]